jgi:predicted PurR-regulated permease PerM
MGNILTNSFITILVVVFLFLELSLFEKKLVLLINLENQEKLNRFLNNINTYFITKTFTSFMTGLFVWIMLSIFNLDYALLFGIMAFLLNFIPSIGSIIAAIPALLIALLQLNIVDTFLIMFWYLVINIVISNFIEPKIMGEKVGLSTLVIFVSMIIWGWIFGPVGMLLAVPLTIIIKIAFDNSEKYHWVSVILSDTIIENIKKEENRKSII